jgi:hypothetical protein
MEDDGTYPADDRSWKKRQILAERAAYEKDFVAKKMDEAKEEPVPSEGMGGVRRRR